MADCWGRSGTICSTYPKTVGDLPRHYSERKMAIVRLDVTRTPDDDEDAPMGTYLPSGGYGIMRVP